MARDLGWMGGKYGCHLNLVQCFNHGGSRYSRGLHTHERAPERAVNGRFSAGLFREHAGGATSALAMAGFRQVREFGVNGKSLGDEIRSLDREAAYDFAGTGYQIVVQFGGDAGAMLLAVLNQQVTQLLHNVEKVLSLLFDQNTPKENAERTDVAA